MVKAVQSGQGPGPVQRVFAWMRRDPDNFLAGLAGSLSSIATIGILLSSMVAGFSLKPALATSAEQGPERSVGQHWDWSDEELGDWNAEGRRAQAICRRVRDREPPAEDRPDEKLRAGLLGCRSEALYYGLRTAADPEQARLCAFVESETQVSEYPFQGRAMLMTIYANGVGARRDLGVAVHLACGLETGTGDLPRRVTRLSRLQAQGWAGSDFDFCDDAATDGGIFACAEHWARQGQARRQAELHDLSAEWTPEERGWLHRLQQLLDRYVESHFTEAYFGGTLDDFVLQGDGQRIRDRHVERLRLLASNQAAPTVATLNREEARLQRARSAVDAFASEMGSGIRPRSAGDWAQQDWLTYRDAFLALAAIRFPEADQAELQAWLTAERADALEAIPIGNDSSP